MRLLELTLLIAVMLIIIIQYMRYNLGKKLICVLGEVYYIAYTLAYAIWCPQVY